MIVDGDGRNPPDLFDRRCGFSNDSATEGRNASKLTSSIEQAQRVRVVTDHDSDGVVIEHLSARRTICMRLESNRRLYSQSEHIRLGICLLCRILRDTSE